MSTGRRWGKAGQRLDDRERDQRARDAVRRRNQALLARGQDDAIAYRLWRAGEVRPYVITQTLNARGLYGPQVDVGLAGAARHVDLWEAGKLYPTWEQLLRLATLVGVTPRFLCQRGSELAVSDTSLRFHGFRDDPEPLVTSYPADVVAATVGPYPVDRPAPQPGPGPA